MSGTDRISNRKLYEDINFVLGQINSAVGSLRDDVTRVEQLLLGDGQPGVIDRLGRIEGRLGDVGELQEEIKAQGVKITELNETMLEHMTGDERIEKAIFGDGQPGLIDRVALIDRNASVHVEDVTRHGWRGMMNKQIMIFFVLGVSAIYTILEYFPEGKAWFLSLLGG